MDTPPVFFWIASPSARNDVKGSGSQRCEGRLAMLWGARRCEDSARSDPELSDLALRFREVHDGAGDVVSLRGPPEAIQ